MTLLWQFDAGSFGPSTSRATPSYVDGKLITVTGERRNVVALNPKTGELLWSFTEPNTHRYEYSMRKGYGKGVAYAEVPGRGGVVFISSPGFFLWALDADTGQPLADWGQPIAVPGFSQNPGMGPVGELGRPLRPVYGHSTGDRLHHVVVTTDRGERHGRGRQLGGAGLQPDARRERPRRHPGLRRGDGRLQVEVPRDPAAGRGRPRDLGRRRVGVDGRHLVLGAHDRGS